MSTTMQRVPVDSSSLRAIGYRAVDAVLEAEFRDGTVYQYFMVPAATWSRFLAAPSKGTFFNQHIRNAHASVEVTPSLPDSLQADLEASVAAAQGVGRAPGGCS